MNSEKEIILIYPDFRDSHVFQNSGLPVGLGYIARQLEGACLKYEIVDLNIDSEDYLIDRISNLQPKFLGISMLSYRCRKTYGLLQKLKCEFPQLQIIAGGPHITANREVALMDCPAIDVGVVREGEVTILEILRGDPLSTIKGVLYRENGTVRFTGERNFIEDLDQITFPTYVGFKLEKYGTTMSLHSSRGCPYRCIFCSAPRILGIKWRKRSAQSMVEEVKYWYGRGYRKFYYSDSNFAIDRERVLRFCDEIIGSGLHVSFTADGLRANHVDRKLLERMKRGGFTTITFGVESGSNKVLQNLKKGETREEIESAIAAAIDLGFNVSLFFLIGSPGEEADDIQQSFQLARKYNVARVWFFNLTPIPGTEFYDWAIARGYLDGSETRYPEGNFGFSERAILPTGIITIDQLNRYIRLARRVERQVVYRYSIYKLLNRSVIKFFADDSILNMLSWSVSHPVIEPVFRLLLRLARVVKQRWRFIRRSGLQF